MRLVTVVVIDDGGDARFYPEEPVSAAAAIAMQQAAFDALPRAHAVLSVMTLRDAAEMLFAHDALLRLQGQEPPRFAAAPMPDRRH